MFQVHGVIAHATDTDFGFEDFEDVTNLEEMMFDVADGYLDKCDIEVLGDGFTSEEEAYWHVMNWIGDYAQFNEERVWQPIEFDADMLTTKFVRIQKIGA